MRTPVDILSVALTEIMGRAEGHLHTPEDDTVLWIARRAREALTKAISTETIKKLEAALTEARQGLQSPTV